MSKMSESQRQYFLERVGDQVHSAKRVLELKESRKKEQMIDKRVAQQIRNSLIQAVSTQGTGASAQVQGFSVAGKTGTTHKFKKDSGYTRHQYRATFIGMLPADKPQYVIAVMIDSPQGNEYYGGEVAAPVFANIATELMRRN